MTSKSLIVDEETWLVFLEAAFRKNSVGTNSLAHLLFDLKQAIESGPDGVRQAVNTILEGIRLVYLYTEEHKLALRLYMLYLTGRLNPQDEPLTLLISAIERGKADIKRARKKRGTAKSNRIGKRATSKRKK
jgi:hypothetical protein